MEEKYGIDIDNAHPKAVALIPEEFFWDGVDELAPFGSDEGDTALAEYRHWRTINPTASSLECMRWVIESLGEMPMADYNATLPDREKIQAAIADEEYDDQYYIFTLDVTVIATGFAQLVDEGFIEPANKPYIRVAIDRQRIWAEVSGTPAFAEAYTANLNVLGRALQEA